MTHPSLIRLAPQFSQGKSCFHPGLIRLSEIFRDIRGWLISSPLEAGVTHRFIAKSKNIH
jgi:hypothetical protein